MQIKVASAALCRALALASQVAAKKSTVPILSNVKLEAAGSSLTLTGTDLDIGLVVAIEAEVAEPGAITIPAKRLSDYVRLLPEGEIAIKTDEKQWASITSGKSRSRIAGMEAGAFPELPQMPDPELTFPADTLLTLLARVGFAVSKEESRFTLKGALLDSHEGHACFVATDGHRLAHAVSAVAYFTRKLLVPSAAIRVLPELDEPAEFAFARDDNHLFFRGSNGVLLIARQLYGSFPEYQRIMPKEFRMSATVNRAELLAALARVSQFSDEHSRCTRFQLQPGCLQLSAATSEAGDSSEDVPCEGTGEIEIGLNAQYVADFLNAVDAEKISIELKDPSSAVEFRVAGDDEYRVVVMPMRI